MAPNINPRPEIRDQQANLQHAKAASAILCTRFESDSIDVAVRQEPWTMGGKIAGLKPQHSNVRYCRSATRPRTCIIYSNMVSCVLIPELCSANIVTIILSAETEEGIKRVVICSAYFPGDTRGCPPQKMSDIIAYCAESKLQLIVGCDANAHHTAWGSTNINPRGESLLEFISVEGLVVTNIGNRLTFVTSTRREVLDLSLCTGFISNSIKNWPVSEEASCSDHRHIRFNITIRDGSTKQEIHD